MNAFSKWEQNYSDGEMENGKKEGLENLSYWEIKTLKKLDSF